MAFTSPRTWVVGEVLTAALLNTHLRDNINYLYGSTGMIALSASVTVARFSTAAGNKVDLAGANGYGMGFGSSETAMYFGSGGRLGIRTTGTAGTEIAAFTTSTGYFSIQGSTVFALTTAAVKITADRLHAPLNRAGGAAGNWSTNGTNTYAETGAFWQAGRTAITITTGTASTSLDFDLPIALSGSVTGIIIASMAENLPGLQVQPSLLSNTQIRMYISQTEQESSNYTGAILAQINWVVIGK